MKYILTFLLFVTTSIALGQPAMNIDPKAKAKLSAFIKKPKFAAESGTLFNGLSTPELKPVFTVLIDQAAKDFLATVNDHPNEAKFQKNIGVGLTRFNKYYSKLDSEDEDRICHYFEELMDCVGLQSSNGQLNNWRYGFDSSKKP